MDVSTNSLSNSSQVDDASLNRKEFEEEKNKKLKEEALLLRQQAEKTRAQMKSKDEGQLGASYGSSDLVANSLGFDGAFSMAATEDLQINASALIQDKLLNPANSNANKYAKRYSQLQQDVKELKESAQPISREQALKISQDAKTNKNGKSFWDSQGEFAKNLAEQFEQNPKSLDNPEAKLEFSQYVDRLSVFQKKYDNLVGLPDSNPQKKEMMEDAEAEISDVQEKLEAFVA